MRSDPPQFVHDQAQELSELVTNTDSGLYYSSKKIKKVFFVICVFGKISTNQKRKLTFSKKKKPVLFEKVPNKRLTTMWLRLNFQKIFIQGERERRSPQTSSAGREWSDRVRWRNWTYSSRNFKSSSLSLTISFLEEQKKILLSGQWRSCFIMKEKKKKQKQTDLWSFGEEGQFPLQKRINDLYKVQEHWKEFDGSCPSRFYKKKIKDTKRKRMGFQTNSFSNRLWLRVLLISFQCICEVHAKISSG